MQKRLLPRYNLTHDSADFPEQYTLSLRPSTYDDHRVAMSFALAGLRVPGIIIENPLCCKKTFEGYFETLERTIASITERQ